MKCIRGCCLFPQRYILCMFILTGLISCYLMRVCTNVALNEMTFRYTRNTNGSSQQYCPPGDGADGSKSRRYILCMFILTGLISCYLMRVCTNVALNEMTFRYTRNTNGSSQQYCPPGDGADGSKSRAEFHWDQYIQHNIILAMYVGYIVAHVPAGMLSDTFGGKHVFGGGILVSSIVSLAYPTLARWSPYAFMAGRVVQGFGQGVMFPSTSAILAKWAPPSERSFMTGIVQSGVNTGNAIGFLVSGVILDLFPIWSPIYYFCGILGLVWCCGWYTLCYSEPSQHPFITESEMTLIQSGMNVRKKPEHTPWNEILTSVPFLAANMLNLGHAWALFTMVNEMPAYMSKVLNFDIKSSGLYSALPQLSMLPTSILAGLLCDFLIKNKYMTITNNRKVVAFAANTLPIPFMIGASYAGCERGMVIFLLCVMMFFKGLSYPTTRALPLDLSPNYAGVLMGIMNGIGSFAGLLVSAIVPHFITGDGSIEEWRKVFFMAAIIMVALSLPFLCFGSAEVQPWNYAAEPVEQPEQSESTKDETK